MFVRPFAVMIVVCCFVVSGCTQQRRGPPLAKEISQNVANRANLSCDDVEAHYRIAQGVRTALDIAKYRPHILQELPGWSAPAMPLNEARTFSEHSAQLLRDELSSRCPKHRITGREDIVYIPS